MYLLLLISFTYTDLEHFCDFAFSPLLNKKIKKKNKENKKDMYQERREGEREEDGSGKAEIDGKLVN